MRREEATNEAGKPDWADLVGQDLDGLELEECDELVRSYGATAQALVVSLAQKYNVRSYAVLNVLVRTINRFGSQIAPVRIYRLMSDLLNRAESNGPQRSDDRPAWNDGSLELLIECLVETFTPAAKSCYDLYDAELRHTNLNNTGRYLQAAFIDWCGESGTPQDAYLVAQTRFLGEMLKIASERVSVAEREWERTSAALRFVKDDLQKAERLRETLQQRNSTLEAQVKELRARVDELLRAEEARRREEESGAAKLKAQKEQMFQAQRLQFAREKMLKTHTIRPHFQQADHTGLWSDDEDERNEWIDRILKM